MENFLNSERISIDITNNKAIYIQIENGMVKQPVSVLEIKDVTDDEQLIINTAIDIIKAKKQ
jgi:hypothetical protein